MSTTNSSSILAPTKSAAAALGVLLSLAACEQKEDTTGGSTTDPSAATGGTGEPPSSTGDAPTTSTGTTAEPVTSTNDDSTAATGTETAGACDHGTVDDCCCFSASGGDGGPTPPSIEIGCGDTPRCANFEILCGDPDDGMTTEPCTATTDDAALDCALEALAAGSPGSLYFELRHHTGFGFWGREITYYLRGDGTAFLVNRRFSDSSSSATVTLRPLQAASFFTDCMATDAVADKIACLRDATTDETLAVCIDE